MKALWAKRMRKIINKGKKEIRSSKKIIHERSNQEGKKINFFIRIKAAKYQV